MKILLDTDENIAAVFNNDADLVTASDINTFVEKIAEVTSSFQTGLLDPNGSGILSFRQHGEFSQLVFQEAPQETLVKWGQYERDSGATTYSLAMPYKIWIADFCKNLLVGIRHFASPEPITELSQPLYHLPLPNTNCKGYSGTSAGWVCIYRTGKDPLKTVQEKLFYAYERESGLHEPYNDANMSQTDGPRFYRNKGISLYENGGVWSAKTQNEGLGWVCNPANLIPILTKDKYSTRHDDSGSAYTFDMAVNGPYYPYYPSRMSDQEKTFYNNGGWSDPTGSAMTPAVLGKIRSDVDKSAAEITKMFNLKPPTPIDFDLFTDDVFAEIDNVVCSFSNSCKLCGQISATYGILMEVFTALKIPDTEPDSIYRMAPDSPFQLVPRGTSRPDGTSSSSVCHRCITSLGLLEVPVEAVDGSLAHAYVMSRQAWTKYNQNPANAAFAKKYEKPEYRDPNAYLQTDFYTEYVCNFVCSWPASQIVSCQACESYYGINVESFLTTLESFTSVTGQQLYTTKDRFGVFVKTGNNDSNSVDGLTLSSCQNCIRDVEELILELIDSSSDDYNYTGIYSLKALLDSKADDPYLQNHNNVDLAYRCSTFNNGIALSSRHNLDQIYFTGLPSAFTGLFAFSNTDDLWLLKDCFNHIFVVPPNVPIEELVIEHCNECDDPIDIPLVF